MAKTPPKSKPNDNASPPEGSELIVIVQEDAGIRSAGPSLASRSGRKVSGLNSIMQSNKASFSPIFGTESRVENISGAAAETLEKANVHLTTFYKVDTNKNLNEVAKELLNDGIVEAAYIKPPAEPPVIIDEDMSPPDFNEDAPPVTPNLVSRQIYLNPAPAGIDAKYAWTLAGGKGNSIRIIDIEGAWRFTHEDLKVNQGGVIAGTQSADIGWRNHGTAVVGEFGGDENTFGITGICPASNTRAISIFGPSMGSAAAIRKAADALSAGDIILIELHRPGPRHGFATRGDQLGYIAVEWWPDDYAAIVYACSKNILVVEAAGNGAENLSDGLYNTKPAGFPASWKNPFNTANPTSNAIVVGAGAPPPGTHGRDHGPDRSRLDFSNYGARVDCQGWGREVTTAGYGNYQGGGNEDFWYTDTFSGTSSASPIVVGALGCIQGRLLNRSKPKLTPSTARNLLRTTGSPQQAAPGRPVSQRIGNRPDLKQAFSTLSIGGIVKIKEIKEFKEKEVKEFKEKEKDKELKESKEKEVKEFKEKEKDKELKEFKEKELKEFKEKEKDFEIGGLIKKVVLPGAGGEDDLQGRIQQLEAQVQQLSHFIGSENRPDLHARLFNEEAQGDTDALQKNADDAKGLKDNKDMETL